MIKVGDHIQFKNQKNPTGIVDEIDSETLIATVNWGTADRNKYEAYIHLDKLEIVHNIFTTDEVIAREAGQ